MVSIRSDDIRGRWGRLIDNIAAFTSLDLSGQSSGIIAVISGQTIPSSVSGQISGFSIGPTEIIAAVTNSAMLFSFSASGGSQSFRFTPANSSGALNISIMDRSGDERLFIQRATAQYNIASQRMTTSGAIKPIVFQMVETPTGTTIEPMRLTTSGDVEFNRSGGTVLIDRGITISGAVVMSGIISGLITPYRGPQTYLVFQDTDGLYKARNTRNGILDFSGAGLGGVVTSIINVMSGNSTSVSGGTIDIFAGDLSLESGFNGWNIPKWVKVRMSPATFINVPAGYSGYVFRLSDWNGYTGAATNMYIEGGYLRETGPTSSQWVGIQIMSQTLQGVYECAIYDTVVVNARTALQFNNAISGGYVNGINVYNMNAQGCVNGVEYINAGGAPFNRNLMVGFIGQADVKTAYGFKDIGPGIANMFIECKMWDMQLGSGGAAVTSNIVSGAVDTVILGGIMRSQGFTDQGLRTWALDDISGFSVDRKTRFGDTMQVSGAVTLDNSLFLSAAQVIQISGSSAIVKLNQVASGQTETIYLTPGNGSGGSASLSLWANSTQDRRFFLQQGFTNTIINSLRQVAGGTVPNIIFQLQDVPAGTLEEPMRFDASGNIELNRSGGNLIFNSGHTMGLSGVAPVSFTSGQMVLSGLNWTGAFTSGGVSGGSGAAIQGNPHGYMNIQVSGATVKIPYYLGN